VWVLRYSTVRRSSGVIASTAKTRRNVPLARLPATARRKVSSSKGFSAVTAPTRSNEGGSGAAVDARVERVVAELPHAARVAEQLADDRPPHLRVAAELGPDQRQLAVGADDEDV